MEGYDELKGLRRQCMIVCQQFAHLAGNIFGGRSVITANFIRQFYIDRTDQYLVIDTTGYLLMKMMKSYEVFKNVIESMEKDRGMPL